MYNPQHPHLFLYSAGSKAVTKKSKRGKKDKELIKHVTILCDFKDPFGSDKPSGCKGKIPYSKDAVLTSIKAFNENGKGNPDEQYKPEYDWYFIKLWIMKLPDKEIDTLLEAGTLTGPFAFRRRKNAFNYLMQEKKPDKAKTKRVIYLEIKALEGF